MEAKIPEIPGLQVVLCRFCDGMDFYTYSDPLFKMLVLFNPLKCHFLDQLITVNGNILILFQDKHDWEAERGQGFGRAD